MGAKMIRVQDDVYDRLTAIKCPDESYSDLLDRLVDRDAQFERGFGAFAHIDFPTRLRELDERMNEAFRNAQ